MQGDPMIFWDVAGKIALGCDVVFLVIAAYQQAKFVEAWRSDPGRSSLFRGPPYLSRRLSSECRARRRKLAFALLGFFVCLGIVVIAVDTLRVSHDAGISY
jgi:hypothetical protein